MIVSNVVITNETVIKTRQWFADNCQACIDEAKSGIVKVNNLSLYVSNEMDNISNILAGEWDHTFTFKQCAYFIQTGKDTPLFKNRY